MEVGKENRMEVEVLTERGLMEALYGLGLSRKVVSNMSYEQFLGGQDKPIILMSKLFKVARSIAHKNGGHNKFLEAIGIWIRVTAPRFWWQQADTYRIGVSKQSESTMYCLRKKKMFQQEDFVYNLSQDYIDLLNEILWEALEGQITLEELKAYLPEGYLQTRVIATNYKTLQNIIRQRRNHKLTLWRIFCAEVIEQCKYPSFLVKKGETFRRSSYEV